MCSAISEAEAQSQAEPEDTGAVKPPGVPIEPAPKNQRRMMSETPEARATRLGVVEANAIPEHDRGQQAEGVTTAPPVRSVWEQTEEEVDTTVATATKQPFSCITTYCFITHLPSDAAGADCSRPATITTVLNRSRTTWWSLNRRMRLCLFSR